MKIKVLIPEGCQLVADTDETLSFITKASLIRKRNRYSSGEASADFQPADEDDRITFQLVADDFGSAAPVAKEPKPAPIEAELELEEEASKPL